MVWEHCATLARKIVRNVSGVISSVHCDITSARRSYKVELNENITAKISELKSVEQGAVLWRMNIMMREILNDLTQDPEYQELNDA